MDRGFVRAGIAGLLFVASLFWALPASAGSVARATSSCLSVTIRGHSTCLRDVNGDGLIRITCIGDSNTFWYWTNPNLSWCLRLGKDSSPNLATLTLGGLGSATTRGYSMGAYSGWTQLDDALTKETADVIGIAFGTNDIYHGAPPKLAATEIRRLALRAERSHLGGASRRRAIVLGAPRKVDLGYANTADIDTFNPKIDALNAQLAKTLPARMYAPHPEITAEDSLDGVHMGPSGQEKRAEAVAAVLTGG